MTSYGKWSKSDREKSSRLERKLKDLEILDLPKYCNRCGQDKGIIHWHTEDYDITLGVLGNAFNVEKRSWLADDEKSQLVKAFEVLCWRCHMMHHSRRRNLKMVEKYFKDIENGRVYPPVYKHNFKILRDDHNV